MENHNAIAPATTDDLEKPKDLSKVSCQEICAKVLETLPLEIRDEIYSHLINTPRVSIPFFVFGQSAPTNGQMPYLDTTHLGQTVAREVAVNCYRTLVFELDCPVQEWLREVDQHGLVRGDHVLHIKIDWMSFTNLPFTSDMTNPIRELKVGAVIVIEYRSAPEEQVIELINREAGKLSLLVSLGYRVRIEVPPGNYMGATGGNHMWPRYYVNLKKLPISEAEFRHSKVEVSDDPLVAHPDADRIREFIE